MRNMLNSFLFFAGLLTTMSAVPGWGYDGTALLQDCTMAVRQYETPNKKTEFSAETMAAERCRSFAWGAFAVLRSLQFSTDKMRLICAPATVKQEQVVRIMAKWLGDNPARLHLAAEYAAVISLRETFPCPKIKKPGAGSASF